MHWHVCIWMPKAMKVCWTHSKKSPREPSGSCLAVSVRLSRQIKKRGEAFHTTLNAWSYAHGMLFHLRAKGVPFLITQKCSPLTLEHVLHFLFIYFKSQFHPYLPVTYDIIRPISNKDYGDGSYVLCDYLTLAQRCTTPEGPQRSIVNHRICFYPSQLVFPAPQWRRFARLTATRRLRSVVVAAGGLCARAFRPTSA